MTTRRRRAVRSVSWCRIRSARRSWSPIGGWAGLVADCFAVRRRAAGVRDARRCRRPGQRHDGGPPDGHDLGLCRGAGRGTLLVECDAIGAAPAPGWTWLDLDAQAIARLEPETSRAAVASWVRERADGWSPLRPAWSRPGWFARASTWMVEQMAAVGRPAVGAPRQHQLWGLSVVLRAPSADGDVFFKCTHRSLPP